MLPVLILLSIFTLNQWSRQIIFYVVDFGRAPTEEAARIFMNVDIGFDETQYGILASIGFTVLFALTSLFAGTAVDRFEPRGLLSITVVVWSLAMVWQAQAHSFADVLGSRMLSGFGQAFTNPAAYTILGRQYPPDRRASVNGIYSSGLYFGGGLAALSILIDNQLGWRQLSTLVGALGLGLAFVGQLTLPSTPPPPTPTLPQPVTRPPAPSATQRLSGGRQPPQESDRLLTSLDEASSETQAESKSVGPAETASIADVADAPPSVLESLSELFASPTVRWLLLASGLRFLAGFSLGVWVVPFYRGAFPGQIGPEFALLKAGVNGIGGSISAAGGGVLTDRLCQRDSRYAQWVPALGSLLAIPFWVGTLQAPTIEASLAFLFAEYLLAECWFGPTIAALQNAAPPTAQGLTAGVFAMLTLVGNLAPALIGYLLSSSNMRLPDLLLLSVPVLYAAAAAAFVVAGERARADTASQDTVV